MKKSEQRQESVQMNQKSVDTYDKYKHVPKQVMEVAQGMEEQFTNHLLSEIQKSSGRELGSAEKIYQGMLDRERSQLIAASDTGLGVKDVIIEDLMRKISPHTTRLNYQQSDNKVKMHRENVEMYKKVNSQKGESI